MTRRQRSRKSARSTSSSPLRRRACPTLPPSSMATAGSPMASSTGRPKGVMVPHRGLANLSAAQVELFGLSREDRVLQFAALSFDAAVWEIGMALRSGATLVLAPRLSLLPGPELADLLRTRRITA